MSPLPGATSDPDLAVLWTMVHGGSNTYTARSMAQAAITGLSQLPDEDRRMLYSDLVERALCTRLRKALEMLPETQKFFSVGHRRSYAKGITQGMATATAKALLTILAQRGLPMTARQRRTISECTKLATLDRWLERAVSVASVDDLLG